LAALIKLQSCNVLIKFLRNLSILLFLAPNDRFGDLPIELRLARCRLVLFLVFIADDGNLHGTHSWICRVFLKNRREKCGEKQFRRSWKKGRKDENARRRTCYENVSPCRRIL